MLVAILHVFRVNSSSKVSTLYFNQWNAWLKRALVSPGTSNDLSLGLKSLHQAPDSNHMLASDSRRLRRAKSNQTHRRNT